MKSAETSFALSKWYLDCVTDSGDVFIGYYLSMRYKKLNLNYGAILTCVDNEVKQRTSKLSERYSPQREGEQIEWQCPRLNVDGKWVNRSSSIDRVLLESPEGNIHWRCYQPGSQVAIENPGLEPIVGLGYVEQLEMTIKPWELPIDELRWGRLVCENDQVVWIEWRGSHPQVLILHNGTLSPSGAISKERIDNQDGLTVELDDHFTLREGKIGSVAAASLSALIRVSPLKLMKVHEHKWRSRGVLRKEGKVIGRGWAIHEVVRF